MKDEAIKKSVVDQVAEDIVDALKRRDDIDAGAIDVIVKNGAVILTGEVPTLSIWAAVHDIVHHTPGVISINDRLGISEGRYA